MKMDKKELRFMNSYFRQFFLKYYEFKVFKKFLKKNHIDLNKKVILDAGCGCGYSTELIIKEFQPEEIFAFDIAPNQIESRFKWPEFIKGLEDNEFHVVENKKIYADRLRSFMCIKLNINSR